MADDEWTIIRPGEEPPRAAPYSGPSAGEWTIKSPPGVNTPDKSPLTAQDAVRIGALGGNSFLFGMGNRIIAASRALEGKESYSEALARLDAEDKATRAKAPWLSAGSELAGGIGNAAALTARGVLRGAPAGADWLAAGVQGAKQGAALGALQGAGTTYSGIPSDYVHNTGMGGVLGAGMGAVTPPAAALIAAPFRAAANAGMFGGVPKELAVAAQADAPALRNLRNVPGGMMPDAGPSMLGTAQGSVMGTGGPGKTALETALRDRDVGTSRRIVGEIDQRFGQAPIPSQREAEVGARMTALGPAYERVLNNARAIDNRPVALWLEGEIGNTRGEAQTALRQVRGMLDIPTNPGVLDPHPRAMQATREAVRGMRDNINLDNSTRRTMGNVYDRLTRELQDKVPGIRELDSQYAELGQQQRAVGIGHNSAGAEIFDTGRGNVYRPVELAETMTEAAQPKGVNIGPSAEPFRLREAARAEMERIVGTNANDLAKLKNVLGEPQDWNSQKLAIMFGQDRADALRAVIDRERGFKNTFQKVVEGSQTAQRTAASKALDASEGKIPWETSLTGIVTRGAQEGWRKLRETAATNAKDRIAAMMATRDPAEIQRLVTDMLATQPRRDLREEMARRLIERGFSGAPALAPSTTNR